MHRQKVVLRLVHGQWLKWLIPKHSNRCRAKLAEKVVQLSAFVQNTDKVAEPNDKYAKKDGDDVAHGMGAHRVHPFTLCANYIQEKLNTAAHYCKKAQANDCTFQSNDLRCSAS